MKSQLNWQSWFLRKQCFKMLIGLQYEQPWLKGQRSILTIGSYLQPFSHKVNISSENNDFGFSSFQTILFKKNPILMHLEVRLTLY